jgi:hypothetical protein
MPISKSCPIWRAAPPRAPGPGGLHPRRPKPGQFFFDARHVLHDAVEFRTARSTIWSSRTRSGNLRDARISLGAAIRPAQRGATLFRRKYYINGSHAGFILYVSERRNFTERDSGPAGDAPQQGAGQLPQLLHPHPAASPMA